MARPRVIIASPDANVSVKLIASLNPKRYRVEHIHDYNEGLLRAELVLAHAAVVHLTAAPPDVVKRCAQARSRGLALVFVSASPEVAAAAAQVGARHLPLPFGVQDVKRAVFRAVSDAHALRADEELGGKPAAPARVERRVVVMVKDKEAAEIMAAVLRSQLAVGCDTAGHAADVLAQLGTPRSLDDLAASVGYDCVVADPDLLITTEAGVILSRKLARRGVPVVPLGTNEELDASSAGQLAWAILPQVRRSLVAREKWSRAVG